MNKNLLDKWKALFIFVDSENILLFTHHDKNFDNKYDDYNTPNTSRMDETTFTMPSSSDKPLKLQLRQKIRQDKLAALYRQLNVTYDPDLVDTDRFKLKKKLQDRQH